MAFIGIFVSRNPVCWNSFVFMCVGSPGMSMPDFDNQTLAALRGRMVRYLMRSREVRNPSEISVTFVRIRWREAVKRMSYQ